MEAFFWGLVLDLLKDFLSRLQCYYVNQNIGLRWCRSVYSREFAQFLTENLQKNPKGFVSKEDWNVKYILFQGPVKTIYSFFKTSYHMIQMMQSIYKLFNLFETSLLEKIKHH